MLSNFRISKSLGLQHLLIIKILARSSAKLRPNFNKSKRIRKCKMRSTEKEWNLKICSNRRKEIEEKNKRDKN